MTIGEKIKKERKKQGLTQSMLAGEKITRNMLSAIESDKASPSLETARYIAERLSVPLAYLMTEDEDLFMYKRRDLMPNILRLFKTERYIACINEIKKLGQTDDELEYILAECCYRVGKELTLNGSVNSGGRYKEFNCNIFCTFNFKYTVSRFSTFKHHIYISSI